MAYRLLYPLRTYLIVAGKLGEEVNVMAADWVTVVSAKPIMVAVAIAPTRYTYRLIERYREFVVGVPGIDMVRDVWVVGTEHGPDKLKKTKLELAPATKVSTPIIENALANLECKVIDSRPYGDHVLYIGEVVAYHHKREAYKDFMPNLGAGFLAHVTLNKFTTFVAEYVEIQ